eukprot:7176113-Pyramimonas_sp.AAC.1
MAMTTTSRGGGNEYSDTDVEGRKATRRRAIRNGGRNGCDRWVCRRGGSLRKGGMPITTGGLRQRVMWAWC